jgi:hypothetical protein
MRSVTSITLFCFCLLLASNVIWGDREEEADKEFSLRTRWLSGIEQGRTLKIHIP